MVQSVKPIYCVNASGANVPLNVDGNGYLKSVSGGNTPAYDITASTVVKAAPGRLVRINIIVAGTTVGNAYDVAVAANAAATNLITTIPNTVGQIVIDWPCVTGITIVPGTGQTVNIAYI